MMQSWKNLRVWFPVILLAGTIGIEGLVSPQILLSRSVKIPVTQNFVDTTHIDRERSEVPELFQQETVQSFVDTSEEDYDHDPIVPTNPAT